MERFQIFCPIQSKHSLIQAPIHSHTHTHNAPYVIMVMMRSVYNYNDVWQAYRLHYSFPLQILQMNSVDARKTFLCRTPHMFANLNGNLSSEWVVLNRSRLGIIHSGSGFLSHISVWFIDRCHTLNHIELTFPLSENKIMQGFQCYRWTDNDSWQCDTFPNQFVGFHSKVAHHSLEKQPVRGESGLLGDDQILIHVADSCSLNWMIT